jgi:hypothetical protein
MKLDLSCKPRITAVDRSKSAQNPEDNRNMRLDLELRSRMWAVRVSSHFFARE